MRRVNEYMNKKSVMQVMKEGIFVTLGSLAALAIVFILYFLFFMLFETFANQNGSYDFVSWLRVGYGIVCNVLCIFIYRTHISDLLKAGILTGSLAAFMTATGVQIYETPVISGLIIFMASAVCVFLLYKAKKEWYHYYAVVISILASLYYL